MIATITGTWVKVEAGHYRLVTPDGYRAEVWQNSYGGWVGKAISPTGETRTSSRACGKCVLMKHARGWALRQIDHLTTQAVAS